MRWTTATVLILSSVLLIGCPELVTPLDRDIPRETNQRLGLGHQPSVVSFSTDDSVIYVAATDGLLASFDADSGAMRDMATFYLDHPPAAPGADMPNLMVGSTHNPRFFVPKFDGGGQHASSYQIRSFPTGDVISEHGIPLGYRVVGGTDGLLGPLLLLKRSPLSGLLPQYVAQVVSLTTNNLLVSLGNAVNHELQSGAFSPDGTRAVLVVRKGTTPATVEAQFWNLSSGEPIRTLPLNAAEGPFSVRAISPDNQRVYLVGVEDTTYPGFKTVATATTREFLWDTTDSGPIAPFRERSGTDIGTGMALFSPDGSQLAVAGSPVALLNGHDGTALNRLKPAAQANTPSAPTLAFSHDGSTLVAFGSPGHALVWDTASGDFLFPMQNGATDSVNKLLISADGTHVLVAGNSGVSSWSLSPLALRYASTAGKFITRSPDKSQLLLNSGNTAVVLNAETGATVFTLNKNMEDAHYSPDGQQLVRRYRQPRGPEYLVEAYDAHTGRAIPDSEANVPPIVFVPDGLLSPDASLTAVIDHQSDGVDLWNNATGTVTRRLNQSAGRVEELAFSKDGRQLAVGTETGALQLWSTESGALLHTLSGHPSEVTGLAFSNDGTRLASTASQQTLRLWNTENGNLGGTQYGMGYNVWELRFSPDDATILLYDGTFQIRNAYTLQLLYEYPDAEVLQEIVFLPDDTGFLTTNGDTVEIWRYE